MKQNIYYVNHKLLITTAIVLWFCYEQLSSTYISHAFHITGYFIFIFCRSLSTTVDFSHKLRFALQGVAQFHELKNKHGLSSILNNFASPGGVLAGMFLVWLWLRFFSRVCSKKMSKIRRFVWFSSFGWEKKIRLEPGNPAWVELNDKNRI